MVQIWKKVDFLDEFVVHLESRMFLYDKTEKNYKNTSIKQTIFLALKISLVHTFLEMFALIFSLLFIYTGRTPVYRLQNSLFALSTTTTTTNNSLQHQTARGQHSYVRSSFNLIYFKLCLQ